jgi:RNA polymerase sigma-70 factor, ECF subfamily
LLREFIRATASGNLDHLVELLADDVMFYSDGGGRAPAVPNVVVSTDKVARLLLGALKKFVPSNATRHPTEANGQPAIASYADGKPRSLTCLDIHDGCIKTIYLITNPSKLHCLSQPLSKTGEPVTELAGYNPKLNASSSFKLPAAARLRGHSHR